MAGPKYPTWNRPLPSRLRAPGAVVFPGVVALENVELAYIRAAAQGPVTLVMGPPQPGSGSENLTPIGMIVPWQVLATKYAREYFELLAMDRVVAKQAPLVHQSDDEGAKAQVEAALSEEIGDDFDSVELSVLVAAARIELERMLCLVDSNQGIAVAKIAEALLQVAVLHGFKNIRTLLVRDDLRGQVYARIFGRGGLRTWQRKAALVAAQVTGLPVNKLLEVIDAVWTSDRNVVRAALMRVLPDADGEQMLLAVTVITQFKGRGREIFSNAA